MGMDDQHKENLDNGLFSKAQLERYLRGGLSDEESHKLEKAALDDPFLSDALEGLEAAGPMESRAAFNELEEKLQTRINQNKRTTVGWWRYAAAAVILSVGSFSVFKLFDTNNETTGGIALGEEQPNPTQQIINKEREEPTSKDTSVSKDREEPTPIEDKPIPAPFTAASKPKEEKPKLEAPAVVKTPEPEVVEVEGEAPNDFEEESKDEDNKDKTLGDLQEAEYSESENDEAIPGSNKTTRGGAKEAKGQSSVNNASASKRFLIMSGDAKPKGGNVAYERYLSENMKQLGGSRKLVVINFKVAKNGKLSQFEIEQGLGPEYDNHVIELLKNGPDWEPPKRGDNTIAGKMKVIFYFN